MYQVSQLEMSQKSTSHCLSAPVYQGFIIMIIIIKIIEIENTDYALRCQVNTAVVVYLMRLAYFIPLLLSTNPTMCLTSLYKPISSFRHISLITAHKYVFKFLFIKRVSHKTAVVCSKRHWERSKQCKSVGVYFQWWINTNLAPLWVFLESGWCVWDWVKIKKHVTQWNSVVHFYVYSFWTRIELYGTEE